jgi:filamentous hemagglutinin
MPTGTRIGSRRRGDFSPDKRHDIWACGSPEQCTALYGDAYTKAGGATDPPTPVGNIAATIEAPNLSITSNGVIQNVGNVIGTSVTLTEQEKAYLYQNALDYAKANNVQLGDALTQAQVNALDKPMLWYVEQTVPDPSCMTTAIAACPTITALMPQVYLPSDTTAMSAGGNIQGTNVTLNFNQDGNGSILNTGSISASDTLTVNTNTLTNQANQVDIGQVWSKVKGGYLDETGTTVQPGGFMSAANMDLNVQTINQIGAALQQLNADGTVNQAGTQALLARLQQQLGTNFSQTSVSDYLHTDFVAEGGFGFGQIAEMVAAVALSIVTAGAGAALVGAMAGTLEAAVVNAAFSALVSSLAMDVANGNFSLTGIAESVGVAMLTAGITNGVTYNTSTGSFGIADWTQNLKQLGDGVQTLGQLAGTTSVVGTTISQSTGSAATTLSQQALGIATQSTLVAGVQTAIKGGSFLTNLETDAVSSIAAVGANDIGTLALDSNSIIAQGSIGYDLAHAALGCAASAAEGTGCASGAIGAGVSAIATPFILSGVDPNATALSPGQSALVTALSMLAGAGAAGALGQKATAAATWAGNESLNNDQASLDHIKAAIGSAKAAGAWLNSFGTAMVTSTGNTLKESALQLFDNAFYSGLPGTPQPQSALYQSIAQNGLLGTAQSVGTGLLNTAQGVMAGSPTAIGSIAGNVVLGVALDRIGNAGQAAVAVEGAPAGVAYTYDAMNPGPLRDSAAGTFAGGRYSVGTIQSSDQVLFKAGDASNPGGSFFNFEMPQSVAQARIDNAVKPYWIDPVTGAKTAASPINSVIAAQFPAGTTYYYGPVGTQGGVYVGGQNSIQIFIPNARAIGTFTPVKSLK